MNLPADRALIIYHLQGGMYIIYHSLYYSIVTVRGTENI